MDTSTSFRITVEGFCQFRERIRTLEKRSALFSTSSRISTRLFFRKPAICRLRRYSARESVVSLFSFCLRNSSFGKGLNFSSRRTRCRPVEDWIGRETSPFFRANTASSKRGSVFPTPKGVRIPLLGFELKSSEKYCTNSSNFAPFSISLRSESS
ncbi:hypothetical protein FQZ97_1068590 [compost metagenome]